MATARLKYDDTSSARNTRSALTLVSAHEEVVTTVSSTDASLSNFPKELKMSQRDFKLFLVALDADEEPSDQLRALFEDQQWVCPHVRIELLTAEHDTSQFDCGDESLNRYIRFAHQARQMNLASTFVLVEDDSKVVLGYYSRVMNSVSSDSVGKPGLARTKAVPVMLLAQFAVVKEWQSKGVGKKLMRHFFERVIQLTEEGEACFAVIVDALNQPAKDYYVNKYNFRECVDNPMRLYLPVKLVRKAAQRN